MNNGGSRKQSGEPCRFGEILDCFLAKSDSPLAAGYRQYVDSMQKQPVSKERKNGHNNGGTTGNGGGTGSQAGWSCDTDMGVDLKTVLLSAERMETGRWYRGLLCRDRDGLIDEFLCRDPHYTFLEMSEGPMQKRNPRVFDGRYTTITRRDDGTLKPNFKAMPKLHSAASIDDYAICVMSELRKALKGLVEE